MGVLSSFELCLIKSAATFRPIAYSQDLNVLLLEYLVFLFLLRTVVW